MERACVRGKEVVGKREKGKKRVPPVRLRSGHAGIIIIIKRLASSLPHLSYYSRHRYTGKYIYMYKYDAYLSIIVFILNETLLLETAAVW